MHDFRVARALRGADGIASAADELVYTMPSVSSLVVQFSIAHNRLLGGKRWCGPTSTHRWYGTPIALEPPLACLFDLVNVIREQQVVGGWRRVRRGSLLQPEAPSHRAKRVRRK